MSVNDEMVTSYIAHFVGGSVVGCALGLLLVVLALGCGNAVRTWRSARVKASGRRSR